MKILITGAYGFVGTALRESLCKCYPEEDILTPTSQELNLLDYAQTEKFLHEHPCNCIIHLAAQHGCVSLVSNKPLEILETNLMIDYNIVHAAIKTNVKKFITLGSSCSYSKDAPLPNKEKDIWCGRPENTYGICKLVLLEHLSNQKSMEWVYLIPPNLYGAGDHFGGENMHLIPATVMKFQNATINGRKEIEVWGNGSQTRDFVYIDDIVYFLQTSIEDERYAGSPINIATGVEISVCEIVERIRILMGLSDSISIHWAVDKPTGLEHKVLNNHALRKIAPDYVFTSIEEGLKKTISSWV